MAPDLFSFGPFFLTRFPVILQRWGARRWEPPDPRIIPAYVYHAYNVTHSLVVWTIVFTIVYCVSVYRRAGVSAKQNAVWPFGAWGLHILCDIPTHSTRFFPTPYLWPFHTRFINGFHWARPSFMLANYGLIALTYLGLCLLRRRRI